MNRRNFFKVSTGVVLLPLANTAYSGQVDLGMWVEENFNCKVGLPAPWALEAHKDNEAYKYVTIRVGVKNTTEADAKRQITNYVIKQLKPLAQGKPELWWRMKPIWVEDNNQELSGKWLTKAEYEDFPTYVEQRERHKQRMAQGKPVISTPLGRAEWANITVDDKGYPIIPENITFDPVADCYRYITQDKTEHIHYVRMRIAVPEKQGRLLEAFATQNETIRKI
jgi:hypothetical protein